MFKFLTQRRLILAAAALLTFVGIFSWATMNRTEDPAFPDRGGLMVVPYPGASPEAVERLVAKPMEEQFTQIEEIEKVITTVRSGVVVMVLVMYEHVYDTQPVWDKVRRAMSIAQNEFPDGVGQYSLNDKMIQADTVTLAITGSSDLVELRHTAQEVKNELFKVQDVDTIVLAGDPKEQVTVAYDDATATRLGVAPQTIANALQARNVTLPGGAIEVEGKTATVLPDTEFNSIEEIATQGVPLTSGSSVPLTTIAEVTLTAKQPTPAIMRINGEPAVGVVVKATVNSSNTVIFGDKLREKIDALRAKHAPLQIQEVFFQPERTKKRLDELGFSLLLGISIVASILFLTMGVRAGLTVALVIPMVTFTSVAIYAAGGGVLQQISIAGLVVALGMLVDNAIVIVEDVQWRLDHPEETELAPDLAAAAGAVRTLAAPLGSSTGTTLALFLPMLLSSGATADFTAGIPIMIMISLTVSYFFAVLVTPALARSILKPSDDHADTSSVVKTSPLERVGRATGTLAVKHSFWTLIFILIITFSSIFFAQFVRKEFFPSTARQQILLELNLPEGSHLSETDDAARRYEQALLTRDEVTQVASFVGESGPRFYYNLFRYPASPRFARIVIDTENLDDLPKIAQWGREFTEQHFPDIKLGVRRLGQGPPMESPIEVRIFGDDVNTLSRVAEQISARLKQVNGAADVSHNLGIGVPSVEYVINDAVAARYNLTRADVAKALLGRSQGLHAGQYRAGDDPVPIVVRSREGERFPLSALDSINIYGPDGEQVPLLQVASPKIVWQPGAIYRRNQERVVTVSANVEFGYTSGDIIQSIKADLDKIDGDTPDIQLELGGELETSGNANTELIQKLPLGITVLLIFLLLQFNSFRRLSIVMMTIPLAAAGVIPGLLLGDQPFGFSSLLGVFTLMGIVVNNGIVLIDLLDSNLKTGMDFDQAMIDAVSRRARPIILTTTTTICGLIPLTFSNATLWPPMAWAIISGLLASTLLTLFAVPALCRILLHSIPNMRRKNRQKPRSVSSPAGHISVGIMALLGAALLLPSGQAQAERIATEEEHHAYLFDQFRITKEDLNRIAEPSTLAPRYTTLGYETYRQTGYLNVAAEAPTVGFNQAVFISSQHPLAVAQDRRTIAAQQQQTALERARYFPTITVEALGSVSENVSEFDIPAQTINIPGPATITTPPSSFEAGERESYSAGVFVRQRVLDLKADLYDIPAQEQTTEAQRLRAARTEQLRVHECAKVFLLVLKAEARIRATGALIESLNSRLDDTRAKARAGRALQADVLKVELARDRALQQLVTLRESHRVRLRALQLTLGLEYIVQPKLDIGVWESLETPKEDARTVHDIAIKTRPDILLAHRNIEALKLQAQGVGAELLPTINAQVAATISDGDPTQPDNDVKVGVALNWTIFASGTRSPRASAIVKEIEAQAKELRYQYGVVSFELEQALADFKTASNLAKLAAKGVRSASESQRVEEARFRDGRANIADVLDAQNAVRDQTALRDEAHIDVIRAWIDLRLAQGESIALPTAATAQTIPLAETTPLAR